MIEDKPGLVIVKPEAMAFLDGLVRALNDRGYNVLQFSEKFPYDNMLCALYGQDNSSIRGRARLRNPNPSFHVERYPISFNYFWDSYADLVVAGKILPAHMVGIALLVRHSDQNTQARLIADVKGRSPAGSMRTEVGDCLRKIFSLKPIQTRKNVFGMPVDVPYDVRHNGLHCTEVHEATGSLSSQFEYELRTFIGDHHVY